MPELLNFELLTGAAIPEQLLTRSRADATAVGYANGWSQALREIHQLHAGETARAERRINEVAARHAEALQAATFAIHDAADQLENSSIPSYDELSKVILTAALDIAEALLGRELSDPAVSSVTAMNRVMKLVPANEPVTIMLSPTDHEALTTAGAFTAPTDGERQIVLGIDETLESGEAFALCGSTVVDGRLSIAVQRLREHLQR